MKHRAGRALRLIDDEAKVSLRERELRRLWRTRDQPCPS
jgi:hypothetical protein